MRFTSAFRIEYEHKAFCQSSLSIVLVVLTRADAHATGLDMSGGTNNPGRTL